MVIQVHFPVIFLFITIIKRRILFFYYETYWLNVKRNAYWVIQQRIIIYTLFETLPIQNIKNKTTQTNKQNYCITPGKVFMILFLFTSQAAETVRRLEKPLLQTIAMTTYPLNDSSSTYTGYFRGPADTEIKNYRGTVDVITKGLYCFIVLWNHFCSWG